MRIAIVHDWLTGMRGGEACLESLCRHFPDAELFTLLHVPGRVSPAIERMRIRTSFLQRIPFAARCYRYLLPLMPAAIERLKLPRDVDLVVSLSHAVAKSVAPPPGVPHVCYCFTPMRYAWHLREDYFPRRHPLAGLRNRLLDRLRRWDRDTSGRVTRFVAISRTVAERIQQCYGRKSRVIYPPVDTEFFTPLRQRREDFYLCVSALVPYKRIELAVEAANCLKRRLLVIGEGPCRRRIERLAGPTVTVLGHQPREVIRDHLRRCRALLFPGQEDFGIVPVEALACGAPVVAFGKGGATETIHPAGAGQVGTGVLFSRQTPECLGEAMQWLESNDEYFSPMLARESALRFNAARFERDLIAYLHDVAKGAPPPPRERLQPILA